jgi:hypothetical protein
MASVLKALDIAGEEDAAALAVGFWLDDIGSDFALCYSLIVHSKLTVL